jgi:hypothetical protein
VHLLDRHILPTLGWMPLSKPSPSQVMTGRADLRRRHCSTTAGASRLWASHSLGWPRSALSEWRGEDLNLRPSGYEPDELPDCSTPRRRQHPTWRTVRIPRRRSDHRLALLPAGERRRSSTGSGPSAEAAEGKPGPLLWGAAAERALPSRRRQGPPSARLRQTRAPG